MNTDAQHLADRFAAVWNESDEAARRGAIANLYAADGVHYVNERIARGHDALHERIAGAFEKNVCDKGFAFRAVADARRLRDVVTFHWEMVRPATAQIAAVGLEVLWLDDEGLIARDYQFIVG